MDIYQELLFSLTTLTDKAYQPIVWKFEEDWGGPPARGNAVQFSTNECLISRRALSPPGYVDARSSGCDGNLFKLMASIVPGILH